MRVPISRWIIAGSIAASLHGAPAPDWPKIALTEPLTEFNFPVHIAHAGDGSGRLFVVELGGKIQIVKPDGSRVEFLNIAGKSGCRQGLLSVAFPRNFAAKKHFYANYTDASNCDLVISRFSVTSNNPDLADAVSEKVILRIPKPVEYTGEAIFHSGGELAFGPDGYLYVGVGDGDTGRSPGDSLELAQNLGSLRGKVLRLDVENGEAAAYIPASNPFRNTAGARPEIWALGVRNPWRSSFDRLTGDFYLADVGQDQFEEINFQAANTPGGVNYGWRIMEGPLPYVSPTNGSPVGVLTPPIAHYAVARGTGDCSVTGGRVYRGANTRMYGIYFFGDYGSGKISGLRRRNGKWETQVLLAPSTVIGQPISSESLVSFGEDELGNLYVADSRYGRIYKLTEENPRGSKPIKTPRASMTSQRPSAFPQPM